MTPIPLDSDPWLTPAEVTAQYRICKSVLAQWRAERRGPSFRQVGRSIHYRKSVMDAWSKAHEVQTVAS
jgi:hypothetical protein